MLCLPPADVSRHDRKSEVSTLRYLRCLSEMVWVEHKCGNCGLNDYLSLIISNLLTPDSYIWMMMLISNSVKIMFNYKTCTGG